MTTPNLKRQYEIFVTETAAPVSMSANVAAPSTCISIMFCGNSGGLGHFDKRAARASEAAAFSFPRWKAGDDASAISNGDAVMVNDGC